MEARSRIKSFDETSTSSAQAHSSISDDSSVTGPRRGGVIQKEKNND